MKLVNQWSWWGKTGGTLALSLWVMLGSIDLSWRYALAIPFALGGGALNLWHYRLLKAVGNAEAPDRLMTKGGLWPWIRHPMYFGELLLMTGLTLMIGLAATPVWLVSIVCLVTLAKVEDAAMARRFPEMHAAWSKRSGLIVPFDKGRS